MTLSKQELVELYSLLGDYDKAAWKLCVTPDRYPRPSIVTMRRRLQEEIHRA